MTVFEEGKEGQRAYSLPVGGKKLQNYSPPKALLRRRPPPLPELSELDLTRHYSSLARKNMGIDTHFYPLGSCTMKLNPRVNEWAAALPNFARTHPLAPLEMVQGNLQLIHSLIALLAEICGMAAGSLLPNAGAQGEFVGLQMIMAYHRQQNDHLRNEVIVPDSAHGTNSATATLVGCKTLTVRSNAEGDIDLAHLQELLSDRTAALMLTNPNTLGLFSRKILEITQMVQEAGGLLYYDGANLNAILHIARPGDMGFDVMHLNLHKTFSTPHGGGGPGSGPVLCNETLREFLPVPQVVESEEGFALRDSSPLSIGRIASFHGNFAIYLRAYLYAILHGKQGLRRVSEHAVLNANYLKKKLSSFYQIPFKEFCMHEFVAQPKKGRALDVAKRLLDYSFHAPTIYFPLIIKECLLIEPTETESQQTLDAFVAAMEAIAGETEESLQEAPLTKEFSRFDEAAAARNPQLIEHLD